MAKRHLLPKADVLRNLSGPQPGLRLADYDDCACDVVAGLETLEVTPDCCGFIAGDIVYWDRKCRRPPLKSEQGLWLVYFRRPQEVTPDHYARVALRLIEAHWVIPCMYRFFFGDFEVDWADLARGAFVGRVEPGRYAIVNFQVADATEFLRTIRRVKD